MSKRSLRAENKQLRADLEATRANSGSNVAGGAIQGPIIRGATSNKGGFFKDTPGGMMSASQYSPQEMELMQKMASEGYSGLKELLGQKFNFAPIAQQARTNFTQTTIPSIAERFSSLGTGGSQRSSAFPQLLSQGGAGLEEALAALQEQYGLQEKGMNMGALGQMMGQGLTPKWENMWRPGMEAGWKTAAKSLQNTGSQLASKYMFGM